VYLDVSIKTYSKTCTQQPLLTYQMNFPTFHLYRSRGLQRKRRCSWAHLARNHLKVAGGYFSRPHCGGSTSRLIATQTLPYSVTLDQVFVGGGSMLCMQEARPHIVKTANFTTYTGMKSAQSDFFYLRSRSCQSMHAYTREPGRKGLDLAKTADGLPVDLCRVLKFFP
jgi:hypothetical protein